MFAALLTGHLPVGAIENGRPELATKVLQDTVLWALGFEGYMGQGLKVYSPSKVDRIWGVWGSY